MGQVAQELSDKKIIKSKRFFTSLSRLLNANNKLKSGYYELQPETSVFDFIEQISKGDVLKTKITLIEGKTIQHYFHQLSEDPSVTVRGSLDNVMDSIGVQNLMMGGFILKLIFLIMEKALRMFSKNLMKL